MAIHLWIFRIDLLYLIEEVIPLFRFSSALNCSSLGWKENFFFFFFSPSLSLSCFFSQAAKKVSSATPQPGVLQSWFPGWYSSQPQSQTSSGSTAIPTVSAEGGSGGEGGASNLPEEDELLNELGYEEMDNMVFRDRIFLTLNIFLVGGSFQLVTTPSHEAPSSVAFLGPEPLVEATFAALSFSLDLRPRLRYCLLELSLGSLSLLDHSDSNCLFPILIQPRHR